MPPATSYNIVTRRSPSAFTFQKLPEVCAPFGLNRSPPFQFIQRLKDFPPSIQDLILVSSTASEDVGIFSRSSDPLTHDFEVEKITNVFTTTTITTDSRRATLPMTEDLLSNTSPIGMALDLSSEDPIRNPLPSNEDLEISATPIPALLILNNEGLLAAWWIIYNNSIKQGIGYPKLSSINKEPQMQMNQSPQESPFPSATKSNFLAISHDAEGSPSLTSNPSDTPSKPITPAFGNVGMLGGGSTAFGSTSSIGTQSSPWAAKTNMAQLGGSGSDRPTTGVPAFGSSTALGSNTPGTTFGIAGGLGSRPSPWSTSSAGPSTNTGSVFGQPGGLGARTGSPFGTTAPTSTFGTNAPSTSNIPASGSGFASFAKTGGFNLATATQGNEGSIFGKATPLSSTADTSTTLGQMPKKSDPNFGGVYGLGSGFTLSSTFKPHETVADDELEPPVKDTKPLFGDDFESNLGILQKEPTTPLVKEANMLSEASEEDNLSSSHSSPIERETTPPADTPAPAKFFPSTTPLFGGQFGTQAQSTTALAAVQSSVPADASTAAPFATAASQKPGSPSIKVEPTDDHSGIRKIPPEPPLPPDPRSKNSYTPSDSSTSSAVPSMSKADDVPLPPDFLPSKTKADMDKEIQPEDTMFPSEDEAPPSPDFLSSKSKAKIAKETPLEELALPTDDPDDNLDDEGSGVDVAQEISPSSGRQSPKATPESSFGAGPERSPLGGLFTKIHRQQPHQPSKPLFGELGMTSAPYLPPPSKIQESPRSPSPIRSSMLGDVFRPDNARSVSAPGINKPLGLRSTASGRYPQTIVPIKPQSSVEERQNKERQRLAAERARQQAEEEQELTDDEDERVREELATGIKATLKLEPFLAHQDYVGTIDKSGIPGQIERVYRDINSMIDTLGLNVRSLTAFTKGHCEQYKEEGRNREDLQSHHGWCLTEIEDLVVLEHTLEKALEQSRLQEVQDKFDQCLNLRRELSKIRTKHNDVKRMVDAKTDPDLKEAVRSAPLTTEQSSAQHDLRRDFVSFQKLLADAEEGLILLRAKLASCESVNGAKRHPGSQKAPTVEAVTNTILKMTSMVTKKSGDIDVLENQMRKLKLLNGGDVESSRLSPSGSKEGSPFLTPPTPSGRRGSAGTNGSTTAKFHTPKGGKGKFAGLVIGLNGTPTLARRKKMDQVVQPEDVRRWEEKARRRREINGMVKDALVKRGVRVRGLDEI